MTMLVSTSTYATTIAIPGTWPSSSDTRSATHRCEKTAVLLHPTYGPDGAPTQAFPAKGKRFAVTQSHWFRIADSKVIEHWANRDDNGMAMQLGWIPPTPAYLFRMRRALRRARRAHRRSTRTPQSTR